MATLGSLLGGRRGVFGQPAEVHALRDPRSGQFSSLGKLAGSKNTEVEITSNAYAVAAQFRMMDLLLERRLATAFVEAAVIIKEGIRRNFQSEGKHFAGGWEQLAAKTLANKAAKGSGGNQMLVDVGRRLEAALTNHEALTSELLATTLHIGSSDPRTHFFQYGTSKMVERPVIGVSEGDAVKVMAIFEMAVAQAILAREIV